MESNFLHTHWFAARYLPPATGYRAAAAELRIFFAVGKSCRGGVFGGDDQAKAISDVWRVAGDEQGRQISEAAARSSVEGGGQRKLQECLSSFKRGKYRRR